MNHQKLLNKNIIISAAADGIGWSIAEHCLNNGANVFLTDINENKLLDRTTFLGSLSQESLAEELRNADLLVHTSKFETFGLVVVEANACGLPVLTLNKGPMKELVSNNVNGFISDHFANDQLKIFVNNIFYDKKESIEIKKSSFKKSKEYSWEKTGKKFSELYNTLI